MIKGLIKTKFPVYKKGKQSDRDIGLFFGTATLIFMKEDYGMDIADIDKRATSFQKDPVSGMDFATKFMSSAYKAWCFIEEKDEELVLKDFVLGIDLMGYNEYTKLAANGINKFGDTENPQKPSPKG